MTLFALCNLFAKSNYSAQDEKPIIKVAGILQRDFVEITNKILRSQMKFWLVIRMVEGMMSGGDDGGGDAGGGDDGGGDDGGGDDDGGDDGGGDDDGGDDGWWCVLY